MVEMIRTKSIYDPKEENDGIKFLEEMKSVVIEICKEITYEIIKGKTITLLCNEKDESICNRKFIKKLCEQELSKMRSF